MASTRVVVRNSSTVAGLPVCFGRRLCAVDGCCNAERPQGITLTARLYCCLLSMPNCPLSLFYDTLNLMTGGNKIVAEPGANPLMFGSLYVLPTGTGTTLGNNILGLRDALTALPDLSFRKPYEYIFYSFLWCVLTRIS